MIRDALPDEYPEPADWAAVLLEDDEIVGHVCASRVTVTSTMAGATNTVEYALGHGLAHWGNDAIGTSELMIHARSKVREWGYAEIGINIAENATAMLEPLLRHGFRIEQIYLRGKI